jgi:hypothetical protein
LFFVLFFFCFFSVGYFFIRSHVQVRVCGAWRGGGAGGGAEAQGEHWGRHQARAETQEKYALRERVFVFMVLLECDVSFVEFGGCLFPIDVVDVCY